MYLGMENSIIHFLYTQTS